MLPHNASLAPHPDVFLVGMYAHQWGAAEEAQRARNDSLRLFVASEPHDEYADGLVDFVDASWAPRRDLEHLRHFTSFPLFFFTLVDRQAALAAAAAAAAPALQPRLLCPLHGALLAGGLQDAAAWRARANFSLLLTTHMPFPRWLMYFQMSAVGRVDHPGPLAQLRTFWWPPDVPNSRAGKVQLLRRYRYSLCPENKLAPGYVTEKIVEAHLAGAVPVYFGDLGAFPEVFNPARVLWYRERDVNGTELHDALAQLERNATRQAEFFAQPVLARGAQAWVEGQCARAVRGLDAGMARVLARQLELKEAAGVGEGWSVGGRRRRRHRRQQQQQQQQQRSAHDCAADGCSEPRLAECSSREQQFCTVARDLP